MTKITFDFLLRISELYFLFSVEPNRFPLSVCPLMKPPQNLPQKLSRRFSQDPRPSRHCSTCSQRCVFSVCDIDNMNSNATNKTRTGPIRVRTQEPEEDQVTPMTPTLVLHQVLQRKPQKMLLNWQLRRSLQAYNP